MPETRVDRMKEITDRLEAGLAELFNSEKYTEYLRVMSQFHHYSFNNTLLIAMQKPDATLVAGYQAWEKKFNRHVMKGEKGIQIIAPAPVRETQEKEKIDPKTGEVVLGEDGQPMTEEVTITIPRFKVSTVFDLAQTEGDPLPELGVDELSASVENFDAFMEGIRSVSPVPIRFDEIKSGAKGYFDNLAKEIVIQSGMSESQTMKTAIHEASHAKLHDRNIMQDQGIQKDQQTREVEAESIAYTVCQHFGLDTADYSFPYIAGWSSNKEAKELKASLDTIRKTASELIDGIERSIKDRQRTQEADKEKPYIDHFYVIDDLSTKGSFKLHKHNNLDNALKAYFELPATGLKALGICNSNDLPGSLDFIHCLTGKDTMIQDYTKVEGWNCPEIVDAVSKMNSALEDRQREAAKVAAQAKTQVEPTKEPAKPAVNQHTSGRQPGPKESVLKALRDRQATIKAKDSAAIAPEMKMPKKGEHEI